jgi:hypothetical protein
LFQHLLFFSFLFISLDSGHQVGQLQLIFRTIPPKETLPAPGTENFLSYVQRFDIVPQRNQKLSGSATRKGPYPDPASSMFVLKHALHQDESIVGDIIPLNRLRALVELTPVFGDSGESGLLTCKGIVTGIQHELLPQQIFYQRALLCTYILISPSDFVNSTMHLTS